MSVALFTFVRMFDQQLVTAGHLLDKGAAVGGEDVLDWRLIEDMHPLRFQLRVLVNFARSWPARVMGQERRRRSETTWISRASAPPSPTLAPFWRR